MSEEETSSSDSSDKINQYGSNAKNRSAFLTSKLIINRLNNEFKELLAEFGMSAIDLDSFEGSLVEDDAHEEKLEDSVNRLEFYQTYDILVDELDRERIKNKFLEMKMVAYYKQKQLFYVLQQPQIDKQILAEKQQRYENKLDELGTIQDFYIEQRTIKNEEIAKLNEEFDQKFQEFNEIFESYEAVLNEIGTNLLSKPKLDRLLRQQRQQIKNLTEIRLKSIKLQNRIKEKDNELKAYGNFYKFEQLQTYNRTLLDRLQHVEDDLMRIRQQCTDTLQKLAHKREKSVVLDESIQKCQRDYRTIDNQYRGLREKMKNLQNQRKCYYKKAKIIQLNLKNVGQKRATFALQDDND